MKITNRHLGTSLSAALYPSLGQRYCVQGVAALLLLVLAVSSHAIQSDEKDRLDRGSARTVSGKAGAPGWVSPDQRAAARLAKAAAVKTEWNPRLGTPLSIRGAGLGQRRDFSGGKGLAQQAGQHERNAIAVMDNLSRFYRLRDAEVELSVRKVQRDSRGFKHVRLVQQHHGLRVFGAGLIVHFDAGGEAYEVNGQYIPDIQLDIEPKIEPEEAVRLAQRDLSTSSKEVGVLESQPALVVFARDTEAQLAFELTLTTTNSEGIPARWRYWVDALGGKVLLRYDDIKKIAPPTANGSPATISGSILSGEGGQVVDVSGWLENTGYHYLYSKNRRWYVYNVATNGYADNDTYAHRTNANWSTSDRVEMSAASNFDFIQRYFGEVHGLNSFDDAGRYARANVHYQTNYVNAYWNGSAFYFGDGNGTKANALTTLDICAHEYTHAVTDYSADLIYASESGALNESFSDIFGTCVEFFAQADGRALYPSKSPGTADWLCGEDCWLSSVALRDLRNPRNPATVGAGEEQPSRYLGSHWYSGSGDNGGVHQNSGVQNFFFYLLCEGGSGNNDGIAYNVVGIGITNAEQVAYRALTVYCTSDTDYPAARSAWISAALDLNASWADNVRDAWSAVGVAALQVSPSGALAFRGPVGGPFTPATQTWTLINLDDSPIDWASTVSQGWLAAAPAGGTVPAYGSNLISASINSLADNLPAAIYTNTLSLSNKLDGVVTDKQVILAVGQPNYFAELFDAGDNDLDHQSFTFTPNGTTDFYGVCQEPAIDFPTDPNGGTTVSLGDDSYIQVTLPAANTVAIYNRRTNVFFIGSNGYLTMNSGDSSLTESFAAHFSRPRVAACFDDLNPSAGGTVSWKQTSELVAVTFSNVREYGTTSTVSFQIEMFFDGRIRITYLGVGIADGLAGLSPGQGVPIAFIETDLTASAICPPPDVLGIVPRSGFFAQGAPGGPFSPPSATYTLSNASPLALNWTVSHNQTWLNVSPSSGSLAAGQTASVVLALTASASSLPAGQYSGPVVFSNLTSGVVQQRVATLSVQVPPPTLAEATDTPGTVWTTGGSAPWAGQTAYTQDGVDAAQSGAITHSQESWMQTTVTGPGTLTYWWSVSSESGYDYLEFLINGTLNTRISGSVSWTSRSVSIADGVQTVRWRYRKDGSANSGQDKGWVDQVAFVPAGPTPPSIVTQPQDQTAFQGGDALFSVGVAGSSPFAYQWRSSCGVLPNATNATLLLSGVDTNLSGCSYWVEVANEYGAVTSSIAVLKVIKAGDFFDDFEPGIDLVQWSGFGGVVGSTVLATNHGGFVSGPNSLWLGASGSRYAASRDLNTSEGGVVDFWLRIANGSDSTWETADLPAEGIVLEYSMSGGTSWIEMVRYTNSIYTSWTHLAVEIPPAAYTPNTRFRWRQLSNSGSGFDHWALDNVTVITGPRPPEITLQPVSQSALPGTSVTFCVTALGSQPLAYQWRKDGTDMMDGGRISGANGPCLTVSGAMEDDSGQYSVSVTNAYGSATTSNATLLVSELDHFVWGPMPLEAGDQMPFAATLTARNSANAPVTNYNGCVTLRGLTASTNTVGTGTVTRNFPMGTLYHDERTQVIYRPAEVGGPGRITALALDVSTRPTQTLNIWTIRMKHTPLSAYTNSQWESSGWTVVYQTNLNVSANGWITFNLTTPFDYNGVDSLMVDFSFNNSSYTSDGYCRTSSRSGIRTLYYRTDSSYGDPLTWSGNTPNPATTVYTPNLRLVMNDGLLAGIDPGVICLTNGIWNGEVAVGAQTPPTTLNLVADDGFGQTGVSTPIRIIPTPPAIVAHPTNLTVQIGDAATFCVTARGSSPLGYYWLRDGVPLSGSGSSQTCFTLADVQFADSGSQFSCQVSNAYGSVFSTAASLKVNRPPIADAGATTLVVISTNNTDARAVLNGSRSSDPDGDALEFSWYGSGSATPLATGMVAIVVLPLGTNHIDLVVSDRMVNSTDSIAVAVLTPAQGVAGIIALVEQSGWTPGRPLIAILQASQAAFARGDAIAAINQLQAFQLMVRAQIAPEDPALADLLIRAAQRIMDAYCAAGLADLTPSLSVKSRPVGGRVTLRVNGVACHLNIVEASTNMVDWEPVGEPVVQADGTLEFEDIVPAGFSGRFYRVRQFPR